MGCRGCRRATTNPTNAHPITSGVPPNPVVHRSWLATTSPSAEAYNATARSPSTSAVPREASRKRKSSTLRVLIGCASTAAP
jgi:hypothetical protein